jgi:hypothetical protein
VQGNGRCSASFCWKSAISFTLTGRFREFTARLQARGRLPSTARWLLIPIVGGFGMQLMSDQTLWKADSLVLGKAHNIPLLVLTTGVLISLAFWSLLAWRLWRVVS